MSSASSSLQSLKRDIKVAVVGSVRRSVEKGLTEARRLSSGPLSPADKRRADYPYARRHGPQGKPSAQPGGSAAIINVVTGRFKAAWRTEQGATRAGTMASGSLVNRDEKTDWLTEGTRYMISRPVDFEAEARLRHIAESEIAAAVSKVVRKYE